MNNINHSCTAEIEHHNAFETLFENSLDGILIIEDGNFVLCNQTIIEMLGYNGKEELLNLHPSKLSPDFQPDGRRSYDKAEEMMQLAVNNGKHRFEWVHTKANNEDFLVEVTLTPITLNNRNVIHVVWKDISKEKETLKALKASELSNQHLKERMELALLGYKAGVYEWNMLDNSAYYSPQWKEMMGYDKDYELPGILSTWKDRVHPNDIEAILSNIQATLDAKEEHIEITHRLKHANGQWIWILGRGIIQYDQNGKAFRMVGIHTDITEQKAIQLKVDQQAQVIEQIHDSVISTDLEGYIRSWNRGSEVLLGYKSSEMIGKHIKSIYLEEDHESLRKNIDILMQKGKCKSGIRLVKKSKKVIFTDLSLSLLKDEKGKPIGTISYSQDITERKKAEDKLREQKDMLHYQAHHDYLTGLPNRILFNDRLEQGVQKASRQQTKLALLYIDLDNFKEINDSLGHDVGDKVLKVVAEEFKICIRKADTLARLGGDEFMIILEDLKKEEDASLLAQKILDISKEPIKVGKHTLHVSASIGISLYPSDTTNILDLLQYADIAMYKAKAKGRNNFQFY
ncbi:diguanylate cyclase domain-containing protein [Sulfurovum sp. CS9]|uniref:diguanylate cyclase domain-containing protein n=1 Tax=Sulfurovum sp. CS9 TaxID=3391146 RepID=UPI0039E97993